MTRRALRVVLAAGLAAVAAAPLTQSAAACSPRLLVVCAARYKACETVEPYAPPTALCAQP